MNRLDVEQAVALFEVRRKRYGECYVKVFKILPALCWAARELWNTPQEDKARFAAERLWWLVAVEAREALRVTSTTDAQEMRDRYGGMLLAAMYHTLDAVETVNREMLPLDAYRQVLAAVHEGMRDLWTDAAVLALIRHITPSALTNEGETMRQSVILALALGRLSGRDRLIVRTVNKLLTGRGHALDRIPRAVFADARAALVDHGIQLSGDAIRMRFYRAIQRMREDAGMIGRFARHLMKTVPAPPD